LKSQRPTLAIVIPAYNEEAVLEKCLKSLARQTEMPDEVFVVDNNSTDTTADIARKFTFVTLLSERQQGIAFAHRTGFDAASTTYIARIDADTKLPDNWIESVKNYYSDGTRVHCTLTGSGYGYTLKFRGISVFLIDSTFIFARLLLGHYPIWGPNVVMPKRAWQAIRDSVCTENDIFDDLDIALHLQSRNYPITWHRKLRVGVRIRNLESISVFMRYTMRWPRTLRRHRDWRWVLAFTGVSVLVVLQYPLYRILKTKRAD
jgi:glycosyltransferase involved in cell wall biosynthesis